MGIWGLGTCGVLKVLDDLETNKFTEAAEGHVVVAIARLDMVGGVAVVVVVTVVFVAEVADALDSIRVFLLSSPCITSFLLGDFCFSSLDSLAILFLEACNFWGGSVLGISG